MTLPASIEVRACEYNDGAMEIRPVFVGAEYPVTIKINGNPFVSIVCSGSDMEELAMGLLVSEGIIESIEDLRDITIDEDSLEVSVVTADTDELLERLFRIHSIASGCGQGRVTGFESVRGPLPALPPVYPDIILSSIKKLLHTSELHKKTRGVHSAALLTVDGKEIVFYDEIGRHNAIDKIVGYSLKNSIVLDDKMILSTGRLSSEIVHKACAAGVPVIASKASPTSLSVEIARENNIILIGKVRGKAFTVFSGWDHVKGQCR